MQQPTVASTPSSPEKTAKKAFSSVGWSLLLVLLFTNAVFFIITPLFESSGLWADPVVYLWALLALNTLLLAIGILLARPVLKYPLPLPFRRPPAFSQLFRMTGASLGALYLFNLLTNLILSLFSSLTGYTMVNPLLSIVMFSSPLATFLFIVVLSPILEELLFRGFVLAKLCPYGDKIAILGSALLFALFHCNFFQFFYAFALGVLFAYFALRTQNLLVPTLLHILVNFFGSFLPQLTLRIHYGWNVLLVFFMILCLIYGLVFLISNRKSVVFSPGSSPLSFREKTGLFFRNAGVLCFLLVCLLIALANLFLLK